MPLDGDSEMTPVQVLPFRFHSPSRGQSQKEMMITTKNTRSNNGRLLFSECQAICKHCTWIISSPPEALIVITLLYLR